MSWPCMPIKAAHFSSVGSAAAPAAVATSKGLSWACNTEIQADISVVTCNAMELQQVVDRQHSACVKACSTGIQLVIFFVLVVV